MSSNQCWPTAWLAEDVPSARLLTLEYAAPVSLWEGESLPLGTLRLGHDVHKPCAPCCYYCGAEVTADTMLQQLVAAGVGQQGPVIFVVHSMGGLLVKVSLCCPRTIAAAVV